MGTYCISACHDEDPKDPKAHTKFQPYARKDDFGEKSILHPRRDYVSFSTDLHDDVVVVVGALDVVAINIAPSS